VSLGIEEMASSPINQNYAWIWATGFEQMIICNSDTISYRQYFAMNTGSAQGSLKWSAYLFLWYGLFIAAISSWFHPL
jgi:hypothetical protein